MPQVTATMLTRVSAFLFVLSQWTPTALADWTPHCERPSGMYRVVALQLSEGLRFDGKNRRCRLSRILAPASWNPGARFLDCRRLRLGVKQ